MSSWAERSKDVLMDTYTRWPVTPVEGHGMYLRDDTGREYLDFLAGIAVNILGHSHAGLVSAITEQAQRLQHCSNLFHIPGQVELAEALLARSDFSRAFFCNSGTEAIESGVKLARLWGKKKKEGASKIVAMEKSFHGRTVGALSLTGQEKYQAPFTPLMTGVEFVPFNDTEALEKSLGGDTCAVILEPIQGEGGIYPADPEYLRRVRELCSKRNVLLLFDEVQCGMGRTGSLFAYQHYGVIPDAVCMAKGLGGGFPIGALLASARMDLFSPGQHAATFGGNPLACSAALAVMQELHQGGLLAASRENAVYLWKGLRGMAEKNPLIREVRGVGLMIGIELTKPAATVVDACREWGLLVGKAGENVVRLVPPLILEQSHIDTALSVLEEALPS